MTVFIIVIVAVVFFLKIHYMFSGWPYNSQYVTIPIHLLEDSKSSSMLTLIINVSQLVHSVLGSGLVHYVSLYFYFECLYQVQLDTTIKSDIHCVY